MSLKAQFMKSLISIHAARQFIALLRNARVKSGIKTYHSTSLMLN